ncbi:MAG: hypothetical protein ACYDAJ_04075 [Nitrosotalea sp.]
MSFNQKIKEVVGTPDFAKFFNALLDTDQFKKDIRDAKKNLLLDLRMGSKIPHDRWPNDYKNLRITNLWVYGLNAEARLVYTIMSDASGFIGLMIEAFRTHKEYEKRFGY